jgi:outer membrane protein assembly factor BamB
VRRTFTFVALSFGCIGMAIAQGVRTGREWMTVGGDAQRSSWIRSDPKISVETLQRPGFQLTWKLATSGEPILVSTLDHFSGSRGGRSFALLSNASGELITIDSDLGRIEWEKKISGASVTGKSGACRDELISNVARSATSEFGRGGGGRGRGSPAKSAVGQPDKGSPTLAPPAPNAFAGVHAGLRMMGAAAFFYAVSEDGKLHSVYASDGEEPAPAITFLPPNANVRQLTVIDDVAYAVTSKGCSGDAPDGVWSLNLTSKEAAHWTSTGRIAGFAFGPDSTVYVTTENGDLVALAPKALQVRKIYHAANEVFTTSPVVFEYQSKVLVAAATHNHLHIVDAATLTGAGYPAEISGRMAAWQDESGTDWLAAPSKDSIVAWKITDQGNTFVPRVGWNVSKAGMPLAPIVINGVVFAVFNSPSAILHAFNADTGKELWNSGTVMTTGVRNGNLSGSASQLYLGTSDGTLYAFGFPIEH